MKKFIFAIVFVLFLAACSGGAMDDAPPPATATDADESLRLNVAQSLPDEDIFVEVADVAPGADTVGNMMMPIAPPLVPLPALEPATAEAQGWHEDAFQFRHVETQLNETHLPIAENRWISPQEEAAISFTLQIDTAAYRNVARMINNGIRPATDAVRIAEMVNYFNFDIISPLEEGSPFSVYTEIGVSPFNSRNYLAFVRVRGKDVDRAQLPASNLTFLIDTSGSMAPANRLPLVQQALGLLVPELDENDIVSIVTYAGCARVLLDSVPGYRHDYIMDAINSLEARGSTAGGPGISTAYQLAMQNFNPDMNNRIILATDGDFNVGVSAVSELYEMMAEYRRRGIHMTILGVGMGNFRDDMLETIARNGNANYHYLDNIQAAHKVFVEEFLSNMFVIAEDVRAQIEFNPAVVGNYRLIGYENRIMDNIDFDNDFRDAGEIGVGSEVVLMFEFALNDGIFSADMQLLDLFSVRIRYHDPGSPVSQLLEIPVTSSRILAQNSSDFTFAAAVAAFGHMLRDSEHAGDVTLTQTLEMATSSLGQDRGGHRRGFVELVMAFGEIQ
ncbi:MAG: von Willebrand factor type A domain-containing protein [Defluviitaleaceae bacterium]|nr:von Willebrand factor type A domain-containing protein [Defluviitaleaceae bacterium]